MEAQDRPDGFWKDLKLFLLLGFGPWLQQDSCAPLHAHFCRIRSDQWMLATAFLAAARRLRAYAQGSQ
jgi:hypothetical protein